MNLPSFLDKHLIPEWRQSWRYLSVQLSSFYAAFAAAWPLLPDDQKASIISSFGYNGMGIVTAIGFLSVVVSRWKAQPSLPGREVSNFKELATYLSVRFSALGALIATVWVTLPYDQQNYLVELLPGNFNMNAIAAIGFLFVLVGRMKSQPPDVKT